MHIRDFAAPIAMLKTTHHTHFHTQIPKTIAIYQKPYLPKTVSIPIFRITIPNLIGKNTKNHIFQKAYSRYQIP
jgi:hypothetical protein